MAAAVVGVRANLEVQDVPATMAFYRDALGLLPAVTMGEPVTFAILTSASGASLGVCQAEQPAVAGIVAFYVDVDDVEEAFLGCRAAGAQVTMALTTHPWGMRDFVILDPDGHQIAIGQRLDP